MKGQRFGLLALFLSLFLLWGCNKGNLISVNKLPETGKNYKISALLEEIKTSNEKYGKEEALYVLLRFFPSDNSVEVLKVKKARLDFLPASSVPQKKHETFSLVCDSIGFTTLKNYRSFAQAEKQILECLNNCPKYKDLCITQGCTLLLVYEPDKKVFTIIQNYRKKIKEELEKGILEPVIQ